MANSCERKIRVLELYSGIGGMHWALKESGVNFEVVMAVDINTTANNIYQYNFPDVSLHSFGLEKLTLKKLESLNIDAILMSPPCQPFTRVGKKGDCGDVRTKSFLHILQLLKQMKEKPCYILVENVKGFETSQTRQMLLDCLDGCGYTYQEFLLTPLQFRVPNCRLRYYMIARCQGNFCFETSQQIKTNVPESSEETHLNRIVAETPDPCPSNTITNPVQSSQENTQTLYPSLVTLASPLTTATDSVCSNNSPLVSINPECDNGGRSEAELMDNLSQLREAGRNMRYCEEEEVFVNGASRPLSEFMESEHKEYFHQYLLTDRELRFFVVMDIVLPSLKKSICFTKRYGRYVEGAGSVVQMSIDAKVTKAASEFKSLVVELQNSQEWGDEELSLLRQLKLRYFTPQEVANLLCFPPQFVFPEGLSVVQKYRVLGNSLNVHVVSELIKLMIS